MKTSTQLNSTQLNSAVFRLFVGLLVLVLFTSCAEKAIPEVDQTQLLTKEQAMVVAVDYVHLLADSTYELRLTPEKSAELGIAPKDYESMQNDLARTNASIRKAISCGEVITLPNPQSVEFKATQNRLTPQTKKRESRLAGIITVSRPSEGRATFHLPINTYPAMTVTCSARGFSVFFKVWCFTRDAMVSSESTVSFMGEWGTTLRIWPTDQTCGLGFETDGEYGGTAVFTYEVEVIEVP